MRNLIKTTLLFFILTILACDTSDESVSINQNDKLLGSWINPKYDDNEIRFERNDNLKENNYGISFLGKNIFIERHFGSCGTPPLVFTDFEGNWKRNGSIIEIKMDNGLIGLRNFQWKIKTLDENILIIEMIE